MNIFIIGASGTGKSTVARYLYSKYGFNHVEASGTIRKDNPKFDDESNEDYVNRLTDISINFLKADHNHFFTKLKYSLFDNKVNVIAGMRNPNDFIRLFNHDKDIIIALDGKYKTDFETDGIFAIYSFCNYIDKYINKCLYKFDPDLDLDIETNMNNNKDLTVLLSKFQAINKLYKAKGKPQRYYPEFLQSDSITEAEREIDTDNYNYKRLVIEWWNKLTPEQQKIEWKNDTQLIFYVTEPK